MIVSGKSKKFNLMCDSIQVPGASGKFSLDLVGELNPLVLSPELKKHVGSV